MRRDYKTYDMGYGKLGVAAVTVLLNGMFCKYLDTGFFEACDKIIEVNGLGLLIIQCQASAPNSDMLTRELCIYKPKERKNDLTD